MENINFVGIDISTKFSPGDRVRYVGKYRNDLIFPLGSIYTSAIVDEDSISVFVVWDGDKMDDKGPFFDNIFGNVFEEDELEKV